MSNSTDNSYIKIDDSVYTFICSKVTINTKGVAGMGSTISDSFANLIGRTNDGEGIKIEWQEDGRLLVNTYIQVQYGYRVPDIALRLQEKVKSTIEELTETKVAAVNVFVQGVVFEDLSTGISQKTMEDSNEQK